MVIKRFFSLALLTPCLVKALEFGGMGNVSMGLGGAGVALENSQWALYYNPALLDMDEKSKFGYSFNAQVAQKNVLSLANLANNLSNNGGISNLENDIGNLKTSNNQTISQALQNANSSITINANENSQANNVVQIANTADNFIKNNALMLSSQNGFVFQYNYRGRKKEFVGSFGIGLFGSAFGGASAKTDNEHNKLIVDDNNTYYQAEISSHSISLSQTSQANYNAHSMLSPSANLQGAARALALVEVPLGYGHAFNTKIGRFGVGITFKYIWSLSYGIGLKGNANAMLNEVGSMNVFNNFSFNSIPQTSHFGLDLGGAYSIKGFSLGLVGKYLNAPKFSLGANNGFLRIDPQVRLGLAYHYKFLTLAWDIDLTQNNSIVPFKKSQMTGGGIMLDFKYIDFRFGAMGNIARDNLDYGVILTGGIGFYKVFDISIQSNLKTQNFSNYHIPEYVALRIGGGYTW
ncbi:conjugal transfer protein TraF [Helicobacter cetorum]|uniref:conjugal transfer protein TraF n=1 Tax=Helicobacter cetorum TaxID=138563 RepID=UPI001F41829E|nr:conjugal transfer protein TraF [Helicobacter cetorum]